MKRTLPLLGLLLLALAPACELTLKAVDTPPFEGIALEDEMGYYAYLMTKPRATTADGARITALMKGDAPWTWDCTRLKAYMVENGYAEEAWEISEAAPLTAGKLSYMMCYAAPIKTSMIMAFTPPSERYALREMIFHELMKAKCMICYISGEELLDVAAKTQEFKKDFHLE